MGARSSKDKVQSSSVVMIILGGGKREMYSRPVSAQEIMLRHPQHVLTHLNLLRSNFRKAIVTPETVLIPGNKYYLVPRRTVEWLLDYNRSPATSNKSDSGTDPLHIEINLGSCPTACMEGMDMASWDPIIASPRRSQDGIEQKPSMALAEEPLQRARGKSPKGAMPKSPLGVTRNSENSPRSWRSSPKVCPGEYDSMYDGQLSDIGFCVFSPVKDELILKPEGVMDDGRAIEDKHMREKVYTGSMDASWHASLTNCLLPQCFFLKDQTSDTFEEKFCPLSPRSASMQLNLSSKQEALACNILSQSPASINNALKRKEGSPLCWRSLSLQESTEACKNKPLFQLLKYPDVNITSVSVKDKQQCISPFALKVNSQACQSSNKNGLDLPMVEPAAVHDRTGAMLKEGGRGALGDVSCLHLDDKLHEQSQSQVNQEPLSHVDPGGIKSDKIQDIAQAYDNIKGLECNTLLESIPTAELGLLVATCDAEATKVPQQKIEWSIPSESLLTNSAPVDLQNVAKCQQNEGCAYVPPEEMLDEPISNLMISLNEESVRFCGSVEEEASILVCQTTHDSKALDVDSSNNESVCKDLDVLAMPTLDDALLRRSPNHLELVDSGIRKEKNVCGMGDVSCLSSSALQSALPSSSVLPLLWSSSLSSSSSSSLSFFSSSPSSSLSLLTSKLSPPSSSFSFSSPLALSSSPPLLSLSLFPSIASASSSSASASLLPISGSSSSSSSLSIMSSIASASASALALPVSGQLSSSPSPPHSSSTWSSLYSSLASSFASSLASSSSSSSSLSSSFSLSPSSLESSLSQLMVLDLPKVKRVDQSYQVINYAKTQRNLDILGFSSLCSDNSSIFEQARAHRRAHLGDPLKHEQERFRPPKQQRVEIEAWQRSRPFFLSSRRIREILKQQHEKRLPSILEFSPELSPTSFLPSSDCPSSSTS